MYAFSCVSFEKLWALRLLRFQWQIDKVFSFNFRGPGFNSVSQYREQKNGEILINIYMHSQNNDNKEAPFPTQP